MVDARNLGVRFFCSSGIGSLSKFGCVPFLFSTSSPKNPRAGLFVLSSIISLIGPEAGVVLQHLKTYGFSELFNAGTFFLTHPTKKNFTTSGQGGGDTYENSKPFQGRILKQEQIWPPITPPTGSPNFLLIVEKCQTFGCVASPDHRIFFLSIDTSTIFANRNPQDHRISFHRVEMSDFLMCCPTRSPNFLLSIDTSTIFANRNPQDHRTFFSLWNINFFLLVMFSP
ncbi:hypothetical protein TNCV_583821 [Trichonephila clavipes]|nr:hypothetical protein TNCV_583821 [Trichonephila clavipes]